MESIDNLLLLLTKVTLAALIGRLLLAALRGASASARYLVAVTTFCSMLAIPLLSAAGVEWRLPLLTPNSKSAPAITTAKAIGNESELRGKDFADSNALAAPAAEISVTATRFDAWRAWLPLIIFGVAAAFMARMLFGIAAIRWITRRSREVADDAVVRDFDLACQRLGISKAVRLLVSDRVTVPLVWGIARPALLLPGGALEWSRDRLRVVFLHELAHLRRGDAVTLLVTRTIAALYWFHPLAWSLDRAARRDCEQACDDLVLAAGTRPSEYADHLLGIARSLPAHDPFGAVTLAMSRRSQLEGRLLSILHPHARRGGVSRRAAVIAAAAAALIVIPMASIRLVAAPSPEPEPSKEAKKSESSADGKEWFEFGKKAFEEKKFKASIAAYEQSIELGYRPAVAMYNIACAYSVQNDRPNALLWLEKAVDNGFDDGGTIAKDSDLDSIRSDPRFERIAGRAGDSDAKAHRAAERYDALRAEGSRTADDWFAAGKELLRVRDLPRAVAAFAEAVHLDPFAGAAWYDMACAQALSGETTRALDTLEQAVLHNYGGGSEKILRDSDLESIHGQRLNDMARLADDLQLQNSGPDWRDAIPRYERLARKYPNIGRAQFNYGFALVEGGEPRAALDVLAHTLRLGYRPGTTMYNLACAHALLGERRASLDWLMKAADAGFNVGAYAKGDRDLESVRDDGWLAERIAEARKKYKHEKKK